jgi:hypothetical protein
MRIALSCLVLFGCQGLIGCQGKEAKAPEPTSQSDDGARGAESAPSASESGEASAPSCRSPSDENCGSCCRKDGQAVSLLRWTGGAEAAGVKPWYNSQEAVASCPAGTPWCAQCLERDEDDLKALAQPTGCDCATVEIGVDPCHARNSCACYCSRLEHLKTACPDEH